MPDLAPAKPWDTVPETEARRGVGQDLLLERVAVPLFPWASPCCSGQGTSLTLKPFDDFHLTTPLVLAID